MCSSDLMQTLPIYYKKNCVERALYKKMDIKCQRGSYVSEVHDPHSFKARMKEIIFLYMKDA